MSASSSFLLVLPPNNKHHPHPCIRPTIPPTNPNPKEQTLKPTPISTPHHNTKPQSISRRVAVSIALAGFSLVGLLDPTTLFHSAPANAAEQPPESLQCLFSIAPSGIAFCDSVVGTGAEASKGQLIKAHYVGKLENGKVFDSSYNRGKPLTFRIGVGEVIKGWDQGILGGDGIPPMLAGGKRTLKLPPELGYGSRGAGCKGGSCIIPPDSTLLFDVEFIGKG